MESYCISFEAALIASHFYPVAHSGPHSVDIHKALISRVAVVCQGCSLMSKPIFIPRELTLKTKPHTLKGCYLDSGCLKEKNLAWNNINHQRLFLLSSSLISLLTVLDHVRQKWLAFFHLLFSTTSVVQGLFNQNHRQLLLQKNLTFLAHLLRHNQQ